MYGNYVKGVVDMLQGVVGVNVSYRRIVFMLGVVDFSYARGVSCGCPVGVLHE